MIHDCLRLFLVDHCVFPCWCKIFGSIWNICPFRSPPPPPWLKTNHLGVDLKRPPTKWRRAPRRSGPPTKWPWIAADGPAGKLTGGAKKHHQAGLEVSHKGEKVIISPCNHPPTNPLWTTKSHQQIEPHLSKTQIDAQGKKLLFGKTILKEKVLCFREHHGFGSIVRGSGGNIGTFRALAHNFWHNKSKKQTQCEDSMLENIVGWSQMNVQNISPGRQHETMQEIHPLQCLLKLDANRNKYSHQILKPEMNTKLAKGGGFFYSASQSITS